MMYIAIFILGFAFGMLAMKWLVIIGSRRRIEEGKLAIRYKGMTKGNLNA